MNLSGQFSEFRIAGMDIPVGLKLETDASDGAVEGGKKKEFTAEKSSMEKDSSKE